MRLTKKLLGFLHRVFDKTPVEFLAFRLTYEAGMSWSIADGVLTTVVTGGRGKSLTIPLASYTIRSLVSFLASQTGYSVLYMDGTENAGLAATVLLDGAANIADSNGDHFSGYSSFLWAYLEAQAQELAAAEVQVSEALRQMSTKTAAAEWLDELGSYYAVPRLQGEADAQYGPRIIAEVLRPRGNNVAIETAILAATGQKATVTDVTLYGTFTPAYNGAITHNAAKTYNAAPAVIYGLFDVLTSYDLLGGSDVTSFRTQVHDLIDRLRDAGTQLRALSLQSSAITDAVPAAPADGAATQALSSIFTAADTVAAPASDVFAGTTTLGALADAASRPSGDALSLSFTAGYTYSGVRTYNGSITYSSGSTSESL